MRKYRVRFIADAGQDLHDIIHYIASHDGLERALYVLERIEETCARLKQFPKRGRIPSELRDLGLGQYREIFFKPYRIIYQLINKEVYIHCILDARRDLQTLLQHRLTR